MLKRFFLYGMPTYIIVIELAIRYLLSFTPGRHEEVSLLLSGPSIAVAGLTLILAVLSPKPFALAIPPGMIPININDVVIININDKKLIDAATIALFVLLGFWALSLFLAHQENPSFWTMVIGGDTYIVGIAFTEWKEIV
jgi:hypothetical protein